MLKWYVLVMLLVVHEILLSLLLLLVLLLLLLLQMVCACDPSKQMKLTECKQLSETKGLGFRV